MMNRLGPYTLGPTEDEHQGIYTGDCRELAPAIPDESVDLVFTDPVYQRIDDYRWLAETAARILKSSGQVLVYFAMYYLQSVINALSPPLDMKWLCAEKKIGTSTPIWTYRLYSHFKPYLWLTHPNWKSNGRWYKDFVYSKPNGRNVNHTWSKNIPALTEIIASHTLEDDIIVDPFCGGGSIIAVCKMLSRRWLAFEIDPDVAEAARQRVRNTQPPLFVPEPEQLKMEIA
jgi:DNA modification methylase